MKALVSVAAILLLTSVPPVYAGDLSVGQVMAIHSALTQMNCQNKVIKDGAKESTTCEVFAYVTDAGKSGLVWQIAENQSKAAAVRQKFEVAHNKMLAALPRKPDGNLTDESLAKITAADTDWAEQPADVEFKKFRRSEIEAIKLQPAIISALLPIIEDDKK